MPKADETLRRETRAYPAEKARQGRIVLTTLARRAVFLAGVAGLVLLALLLVLP